MTEAKLRGDEWEKHEKATECKRKRQRTILKNHPPCDQLRKTPQGQTA